MYPAVLILSFLGSFLGCAAYFFAVKIFDGDKVSHRGQNVSQDVQSNAEGVPSGTLPKRSPVYNTPEKAALHELGKKLPEQWRR